MSNSSDAFEIACHIEVQSINTESGIRGYLKKMRKQATRLGFELVPTEKAS